MIFTKLSFSNPGKRTVISCRDCRIILGARVRSDARLRIFLKTIFCCQGTSAKRQRCALRFSQSSEHRLRLGFVNPRPHPLSKHDGSPRSVYERTQQPETDTQKRIRTDRLLPWGINLSAGFLTVLCRVQFPGQIFAATADLITILSRVQVFSCRAVMFSCLFSQLVSVLVSKELAAFITSVNETLCAYRNCFLYFSQSAKSSGLSKSCISIPDTSAICSVVPL